MKVYTCTKHPGMYPTGVASVVVAAHRGHGRRLLADKLAERGLWPADGWDLEDLVLTQIDTKTPRARILQDGEY